MKEKDIDRVLDTVELYVSTLGISVVGVLAIFCGGFVLGRDFIGGLLPFACSVAAGWIAIRYGWREYKYRKRDYDENPE